MTRPGRLTVTALAALLVVAVTVTGWSLWTGPSRSFGLPGSAGGDDPRAGLQLVVVDHGRDEVVYRRPVTAGERFELRHVHSVTRRPVRETFSVAGAEGIAMEQLWFDEFGANLPAGPETIGEVTTSFERTADGFVVDHHGRLLPTVPLRVGGPSVDHVLIFADGQRLRLLTVADRAAHVELRVAGGE